MIDEVTARRQKKCAESPQGHNFHAGDHGICTKCLLKVDPPPLEKKTPKPKRVK